MKKIIFLLCIFVLLSLWVYKEPMYSDLNEKSIEVEYPKKIDRYSCEDKTYQYCYNGNINKKDIFGNKVDFVGVDYSSGKSYSYSQGPRVYLSDFNTTELKGSSKTREVYYDPYKTCNPNYPWRLDLSSNKTINNECSSPQDIENYNMCLNYEKLCPFEDIEIKQDTQYIPYDCSDKENVIKSLEGLDVTFVKNTTEVGSYRDTRNRALPVYKGRKNAKGEIYDSEKCSEECSEYNYYALQHGNYGNPQCFCGNSLEQATQYGAKKCPKTGGGWCNYIYKNICGFETTDDKEYSNTCEKNGDKWVVKNMEPIEEKCKERNCSTSYYNTPNGDVSNCFLYEAEASYEYDDFYKGTSKYPYDTPPSNPLLSSYKNITSETGIIDGDKVKIRGSEVTYSVPVCDEENPFYANNECRPENTTEVDISCSEAKPYLVNGICVDPDTALSVVTDGCNEKTPYKKENACYATPEETLGQTYTFGHSSGNNCYVKELDYGISCENIFSVRDKDNSMLYNPITNKFVGDLNPGDYAYVDCSGGKMTKCMKEFPFEKNDKNEYVLPLKPRNSINRDKIPTYDPTPKYVEPEFSKYINPYNSDIQHSLFIQCKEDYSTHSQESNMCPQQLPLCEGYVKDTQFGLCKEDKKMEQTLSSYTKNVISCENNYDSKDILKNMCPYNFPYCENNECKQSSLYNLVAL